MDDVYGEPDAGDGTSLIDARVNRVQADFVRAVQRGAKIVNRPPGSKVLTLPEKREDYQQNYKGNVPAKVKLFQQMVAQSTPIDAVVQYSAWIEKMEKE